MTAHTPGPWRATIQGSDTIYIHDEVRRNGPSYGTIAEIGSDSAYPEIHKRDKANAHLIAAAPEMYEALVALSQQLCSLKEEKGDLFCKMETLCDIAIAKAQGDQGRVEVLSELPQLAKAEGKEEE